LRSLQIAHRVIRASPHVLDSEMERLLAFRALNRLSYEELFKYSPDPFGDWSRGHYDRLAEAEPASVGLRRRGFPDSAIHPSGERMIGTAGPPIVTEARVT